LQIRQTSKDLMTDGPHGGKSEDAGKHRSETSLRPIEVGFRRLAVVIGILAGIAGAVFAFWAAGEMIHPSVEVFWVVMPVIVGLPGGIVICAAVHTLIRAIGWIVCGFVYGE